MTQTVFIIIGVLALLILFFWMVPLRLWFIAILNGVHVSLVQLIRKGYVLDTGISNEIGRCSMAGYKGRIVGLCDSFRCTYGGD